jgi:formylmethanofuran dehydrogenase subunit C
VVTLRLKRTPDLCLDVEGIIPEAVQGKTLEEIEKMEILNGSRKVNIGDYFDVTDEGNSLIFEGDLSKVKRIGMNLRDGEILVKGNAGMYVGAFMRGGKITVEGSVDAFSALNMKGGELIVRGNAGDYLGASYRGDWRGMSSGKILVEGDAGKETGCFMCGGVIIIRGTVDSYCGVKMKGGTIFANKARTRAGASMMAGSIILNSTPELLPGFFFERKMEPEIEKLLELEKELIEGEYHLFSGDHAERGAKGKIYVREFISF